MSRNDLILALAACIVLAPIVCGVVWLLVVVAEDLIWRMSGLWVRWSTWLQNRR